MAIRITYLITQRITEKEIRYPTIFHKPGWLNPASYRVAALQK